MIQKEHVKGKSALVNQNGSECTIQHNTDETKSHLWLAAPAFDHHLLSRLLQQPWQRIDQPWKHRLTSAANKQSIVMNKYCYKKIRIVLELTGYTEQHEKTHYPAPQYSHVARSAAWIRCDTAWRPKTASWTRCHCPVERSDESPTLIHHSVGCHRSHPD